MAFTAASDRTGRLVARVPPARRRARPARNRDRLRGARPRPRARGAGTHGAAPRDRRARRRHGAAHRRGRGPARCATATRATARRRGCPSCARRSPTTSRARAASPFEAGRVVVAPGAKPFLLFSVLATCNPGDEVVYPDPGFPIYESVIRFAGAMPVPLPAHRGARLRVRRLRPRRSPEPEDAARDPQLPGQPDRRRDRSSAQRRARRGAAAARLLRARRRGLLRDPVRRARTTR